MKLIRVTDDRYILDGGEEVTEQRMEEMQRWFDDWFSRETAFPAVAVFGGSEFPLEYEDHRDSDLEGRVRRLEEHIHFTEIDHGWTRGPIEPIGRPEPPVGGIEQYQAEDR